MASEDARKLFVAGLPDSVTEEVLRGLFVESGARVSDLSLPRDRMSGRPRGFAFVSLGSQEDADLARQVLDGRIVDGRSISVRPFQAGPPARGERALGAPRGDRGERGGSGGERGPARGGERGGFGGGNAPDCTLYVGNLPYDTTQEEVESVLQQYGAQPVVRVHLPLDQEGRRRGFGFVTMGSSDVAKAALDQLRSAELRGRRLVINLAHPKGETRPRRDEPAGASAPPPRAFPSEPRFPPPPAAASGAFGPPVSGKNDGRRKKKFEEGGGGRPRRDRDDPWRDHDDD